MPVDPPPSPVRRNPWVSRLGRAAVAMLVVGTALTAVQFVWPDDGPPWLGLGGAAFYLGVILVALWTVVRLLDTSSRLRVPRRDVVDDQDGRD